MQTRKQKILAELRVIAIHQKNNNFNVTYVSDTRMVKLLINNLIWYIFHLFTLDEDLNGNFFLVKFVRFVESKLDILIQWEPEKYGVEIFDDVTQQTIFISNLLNHFFSFQLDGSNAWVWNVVFLCKSFVVIMLHVSVNSKKYVQD